jgi:hypothetical protein
MKVKIDSSLTGKSLFDFLHKNKGRIIADKKAVMKQFDSLPFSPSYMFKKEGQAEKTAAQIGEIPDDATVLDVTGVGNTTMWADLHKDVIIRGAYKKTLKERADDIYHLVDHNWGMENGDVGDMKKVYTQDIALSKLGVNKDGKVEALLFDSEVKEDYNKKIFNKYKTGKVKQHSVGIFYVKIALAINDKDYPAEYEIWTKHIEDIVNKSDVKKDGFFWAVYEVKLIEISAVRLGANELTPTLTVSEEKSADQDEDDTEEEESTEKVIPAAQPLKAKSRFGSIGSKI